MKDESGNIVVQTIRNMQVVCLTTDEEFSHNKFSNPMHILASNQRYGHLNIRNASDSPTILPAQIAVLTKQSAQNHGMVKGAYIPAASRRDFYDAGCVQGSQTGHIRESRTDTEVRFIPFGAREYIFEKVNVTGSHTNIYDAIDLVGKQTGANSGTYLDQYFSRHSKELEQFIAHFERPKNTIGVIVLVDGEIVSIDKFPSFEYTEQVWDALIRDCYGSIALTEEKKNSDGITEFSRSISKSPRGENETVAAYLKRILSNTKKSMSDSAKERLSELMSADFNETVDSNEGGYLSEILKSSDGGYIGQVISEAGFNHLVSICKKESFSPERFRKANVMRQKARNQNKFEL
jgi:hypothetical protein